MKRFGAYVIAACALASCPAVAQEANSEQLRFGAYLVRLGDCEGCHTAMGGAPYAGGVPLPTPFGTIYSSNLTPDKETGIGNWTDDQFYRALHEGRDDDGAHLYPAFPYPYFTRMSRMEIDAIHAYLKSLPPVSYEPPKPDIWVPRFLVTFWNMLNFDDKPFQRNPQKSDEWNRGFYIVTGPGHCGACHTPKNWMAGDKNGEFLTGGVLDNWFAANLTSDAHSGLASWNAADIAEYLKQGRNSRATASGSMQDVIVHSTTYLNDADLHAIAVYLKDLPPGNGDGEMKAAEPAAMKAGEAIFVDQCAACHRQDGSGVAEYFPPLMGSATVQSRDPTTILRVILEGTASPATEGKPTPLAMPSFAWKLDDQEISDVATYIRNSWGNSALPADKDQVAKLRQAIQSPQGQAQSSLANKPRS